MLLYRISCTTSRSRLCENGLTNKGPFLTKNAFKQAAIGLDDRLEELPDVKLPTDFRYPESTPVLFGHYWMQGEPTIMNTAAVALGPRASAYQAKASRRAREALVAGGRLHNLARG